MDPYERPPDFVRGAYKRYQKTRPQNLHNDCDVLDFDRGLTHEQEKCLSVARQLLPDELNDILRKFCAFSDEKTVRSPVEMYEHSSMPGLLIAPVLVPPRAQLAILSRLLHRDLSNPMHLTNIHTHYRLAYPHPTTKTTSHEASFFAVPPSNQDTIASPLDPSIHRSLSIAPLLNRKLRWMTLGGQYDWTLKQYPSNPAPSFPSDLKDLLEHIFPETKAEAAILNLYSPGDTLSVHRDVSEFCDKPLTSISLGCDAIFIIGSSASLNEEHGNKDTCLTLRLPSGSAVYMSGKARYAWHGVPQVIAGTCPSYLRDWPALDDSAEYQEWKGWMGTKRINLNVRQMYDSASTAS